MITPFKDRMGPASRIPAYREADYWVWCGSPVQGEDGRYHLFASRWSKQVSFHDWATHSEIVRAVSDRPAGPYQFEEVVLADRGEEFWDGRVTHNPTIRKWGEQFLLFYTGTTYKGPFIPAATAEPAVTAQWAEAWNGKRCGLAVADSVYGPWKRMDRPLLEPREGKWDAVITSNPAPCLHEDGGLTLVYKSTNVRHSQGPFSGRFHLGCAKASHWSEPLLREGEGAIHIKGRDDHHLEDGFVWWNGDAYELIAKDMTGEICGEAQAAIHAFSPDALNWELAPQPKAYSRTVKWDDGSASTLSKLERSQILFDQGEPAMLFAATLLQTDDGEVIDSHNLAFPLKP
ncbi:glycoside hydrolase family protein [Kiritimatiellaeota bacterium B1221]|nr:glycoside hydrolase family protein [Kiritimatiellaeota bacterium B1221]